MADFVVGASLKATRAGSIFNGGSLVTTPIPFSGLRSINCGTKGSNNGLYLPLFNQPEYSFYNDFTVECFLRGDGTTNDGSFLSINVSRPTTSVPAQLNFCIDGDELQLNNQTTSGGTTARKKVGVDIGTRTATDWYHFACVRKDDKYSLFWNGNRVAYDVDSAGNGTADYIDIQTNDAYLFQPIAGTSANGSIYVNGVQIGSGGNTPSDNSFNPWGGYIANYRTSYIAQYDPSSSTYTVPSAAFSNFSATSYYYKDATNNDFFNESDNLPTTFVDLNSTSSLGSVTTVEENNIWVDVPVSGSLVQGFVGDVTITTALDAAVTGQSLTSSEGSVGAGLGILVSTTGVSGTTTLGNERIPAIWSDVPTGTVANWTEVET